MVMMEKKSQEKKARWELLGEEKPREETRGREERKRR
jgi:hypothetical protein